LKFWVTCEERGGQRRRRWVDNTKGRTDGRDGTEGERNDAIDGDGDDKDEDDGNDDDDKDGDDATDDDDDDGDDVGAIRSRAS
jgi:hypothetical protein